MADDDDRCDTRAEPHCFPSLSGRHNLEKLLEGGKRDSKRVAV